MIKRLVRDHVLRLWRQYPALTLVGPRQCGKTTLARTLEGEYFDLEKDTDRLRLEVNWGALISGHAPLILDEAQSMSEVFPRLRSAIDEDRKRNGRFLLLGSVSPSLMREVGEALTGRMALCELTPFHAMELPPARHDDLWRFGGYPGGGVLKEAASSDWARFYLELMAQRDLPAWGLPARPQVTARLFRMLSAIHGQVWNASQIGQSMGLSYHTVNGYLDFLEGAYLVRRLPACAANIRKRLVRTPKLYWRDSGLLHSLLGLTPGGDLYAQPWVGFSWEGWVIEQVMAALSARGERFEGCHLRTSDQKEIDLLLEWRRGLWAFEIKLTSTPSSGDLERLRASSGLVKADFAVLVSRTASPILGERAASLPLVQLLDMMAE